MVGTPKNEDQSMEDENDFEKFLYGKKEGSTKKNERVNIHKS